MDETRSCEENRIVQRRTVLASILAGFLTPLLTGCGDDKSGGTLRIQMPLPNELDPATLQSDLDAQLAAHVYSGLVALNAEGDPIPDLAQRWSMSADGRTYQFPLRPGLRFHDGEQLVAAHIKDTWEHLLDPRFESPRARLFLGNIVGFAQYRNEVAQDISGVRAVNARTLEIDLIEPDLTFPTKLTHPTTYVQAPSGIGNGASPQGSGPFAVVDWVPGELLTLARSEGFYGFEPLLDRIEITGRVGAQSLSGYADDSLDILYVDANDIAAVLDRNNPLHKDLVIHDALEMTFLAMNNRIPPFDDEGVRQAFAFAIDRAAIVEQVFSNTVGKATSLLPPSLAHNGDAETVDFDIFKARQALAESRYRDASNLPEVTFTVPGTRGPTPPTMAALINMFQEHLGIRVRIQREPWATFVGNLESRDNPYQLFLFTRRADYPDPQALLDPLFRSTSLTNYSGYRSPEVDALLLQARGEQDKGRRRTTIGEIEQRIALDAPVTPLWHGKECVLIKPWVRDVQLSATARPWLNRVYLDS